MRQGADAALPVVDALVRIDGNHTAAYGLGRSTQHDGGFSMKLVDFENRSQWTQRKGMEVQRPGLVLVQPSFDVAALGQGCHFARHFCHSVLLSGCVINKRVGAINARATNAMPLLAPCARILDLAGA